MTGFTDGMDKLLADDLAVFSKLTPKRKAAMILGDYKNSYYNSNKCAKAKTDEERDMYQFHRMRFYTKAQKELAMLDSDEMSVYLATLEREIGKDLSSKLDYGKLLEKYTLYSSATFMLREQEEDGVIKPPAIKVDGVSAIALNRVVTVLEDLRDRVYNIGLEK